MFNKVTGHISQQNPEGEAKVLFRATAINAEQYALTQEIIAHYEGRTVLSRKECRDAHGVLRPGRKAAPYFISKNLACKVKGQHGMYDLSRLKLSAAAAKPAPEATETEAPAPKSNKKPSNKKVAAKKEAKGKKEKKQIEAPAAAPEVAPAENPL